ncbi:MAG: ABC transporter permease [Patescibacteria group bacterium]
MILIDHMRMARSSIRANRFRSFLTMLGVIIGVASVVTIIGIGEGIKNQVNRQSEAVTKNIISVRPGHLVDRDSYGAITRINILPASIQTGSVSLNDAKDLESIDGVERVVPMSLISGVVEYDQKEYGGASVIATKHDFINTVSQKIEFGAFYGDVDKDKKVAVIGKSIAEDFFGEVVPIGKTFSFRGQDYIVRGVFEEFPVAPLTQNINYNTAIFIPDNVGYNLGGSKPQLYELLVDVKDGYDKQSVVRAIDQRLKSIHGGQEDFTVLRSDEMSLLTSKTFDLISSMTVLVAVISLLVGGVGIMNVMLVTVSERSREIGIRKAVGASNSQIRWQFLIESMVLSFWGSLFGILLAGIIMVLLRVLTNLEPVMNPVVVVFAVIGSVFVGVIFGIAPARKAANKDPIDSLRSM